MTVIQILFYVFATVAVCSGLTVIFASHPMRSVLALVVTFFAAAGIWMLLHAEFLSLILILVYVGAVMTLFLFVVMMLSPHMKGNEGLVKYFPIAIIVVGLVLAIIIISVGPEHFGLDQAGAPDLRDGNYSNVSELGMMLYTHYAYPFEIAAVLLLTAIVAAISLAHRKPSRRRNQKVSQQIATRREDSVRLVSMPAEKKNQPTDEAGE